MTKRTQPPRRDAMFLGFLCACLVFGSLPAEADEPARLVRVLLQTEKGDIEVELDSRAPITVANFLRYVDGKVYDSGHFHRTVKQDNQPDNKVKIEVVQAGPSPDRAK